MMKMRLWGMGVGALVLGLSASPAWAFAEDEAPGPIDSLDDLQDSGKMVFKLADANNDGQISQKEATDAGNLMVGGFFFRADADGDGVVSKDEAQQARESFIRQKPLLRIVLDRATQDRSSQPGQPAQEGQRTAQGAKDAMQGLMGVVDANSDGQLQAAELRQVVQTGVQGLYASADSNRDGQMSPSEVNAAILGMARAAAQASFQAADNDGNGSLSQAEFQQAIIEPANAVFRVVDANSDGQLSQQEAQTAQRVAFQQIRMLNVPEPANSLGNRIDRATQSGTAPALGSPTTTTPRRAAPPAQRARPAQPAAPAPGTQTPQ